MIGCDIVQVKRIIKNNKAAALQQRILSIAEQEYLAAKSTNRVKGRKFTEQQYSLAGMFAAKEATLKALGMGMGDIALNKITIMHKNSGEPYINIDSAVLKNLKIDTAKKFKLSIAHDGDYAMAVVQLDN